MKKLATLAVLAVVMTGASVNAAEFRQNVDYYLNPGTGMCNTCNTCNTCSVPTTTCKTTCCTPTCVKTCDAPCGKMVCCPNIVGIFGW